MAVSQFWLFYSVPAGLDTLSSLGSFLGHYYPWLFNLHVPFVKCLVSDPRSHPVLSCLHLFRIPIASSFRTSQSESLSLTHLANIYQVPVRPAYLICSDFPATLRAFTVKSIWNMGKWKSFSVLKTYEEKIAYSRVCRMAGKWDISCL